MKLDSGTLALYIGIILSTFLFASFANKLFNKGGSASKKGRFSYLIAYFIAGFFYVFNNTGVDYDEYIWIFDVCKNDFQSSWVEPGFAVMNYLLSLVFDRAEFAVSFIKLITISMVFYSIYCYRNVIHIGFSVLFYMSMLYFDAICLIRIHLAAAIIFAAITLYYKKQNIIWSVVLLTVAVLIHYSSVIFLGAVALYLLFKTKKITTKQVMLALVVVVIINIFALSLLEYFISNISFLIRYSEKYSELQNSGSGVMQYIFHGVPALCVVAMIKSKFIETKEGQFMFACSISCIILSLISCVLGYSFQVVGRAFVHFMFIWVVTIPLFIALMKNNRNISIYKFFIFLFAMYRFYDFISAQAEGLEHFTLIAF